jgi:PRTRC genetic system protein B
MKVVKTISIYQSSNRSYSAEYSYDNVDYNTPYLQVNDIRYTQNGEPIVEAGRALSMDEASKIFSYLNSGKYTNKPCLLPSNVLMWHRDSVSGGYRCIFWEKGRVAHLHHARLENPIEVPWPSLIFDVSQVGISVYAIKNKRNRPNDSTKLFHAPLFNTYHDSRMCMGNCRMEKHETPEDVITAWCDFMYNSRFTMEGGHHYGGSSSLLEFWTKLEGEKTFPVEILKPLEKNLGSLV